MTNNPKTRNSFFCCATQSEKGVQLSGMAALKEVPCPYQKLVDLMGDRCILSNFQPGELFFYEIIEYKDGPRQPDNELQIERGIGSIKEDGQLLYLDRITPLSSIDGPITRFIEFSNNKNLFVQTYIPKDYRELFSTPNTILATEVAGCPSPVELQDYTLLGRLNGTIQSIDNQEVHDILGSGFASKSISRDSNDITSPSSKFSLTGKDSMISSDYFKLSPKTRRPTKKIKGQIIYNSKTDSLEYWNGKQWRSILTK